MYIFQKGTALTFLSYQQLFMFMSTQIRCTISNVLKWALRVLPLQDRLEHRKPIFKRFKILTVFSQYIFNYLNYIKQNITWLLRPKVRHIASPLNLFSHKPGSEALQAEYDAKPFPGSIHEIFELPLPDVIRNLLEEQFKSWSRRDLSVAGQFIPWEKSRKFHFSQKNLPGGSKQLTQSIPKRSLTEPYWGMFIYVSQVDAQQWSGDAAASRLRRCGTGAQLLPLGAFSPANRLQRDVRRRWGRQHSHCQPDNTSSILSSPQETGISNFNQ